ncbi:MAG: hypothetical protein ABI629_01120 [bacterium]
MSDWRNSYPSQHLSRRRATQTPQSMLRGELEYRHGTQRNAIYSHPVIR